jgi:hypothetical protein
MPYEIIGRFYFKKTSNGNLIGEWSNNKSDEKQRTSTESCDLKKGEDKSYIGLYRSTWQEDGTAHFADLTISK